MPLRTLAPDSNSDEILQAMEVEGAATIRDVISAESVTALTSQLIPHIDRTPMGRDIFTGHKTQRTGALVARAPLSRELVTDPTILGAARDFLAPFTGCGH